MDDNVKNMNANAIIPDIDLEDNDLNFERDFGQWFNPNDDLLPPPTPQPVLSNGGGGISKVARTDFSEYAFKPCPGLIIEDNTSTTIPQVQQAFQPIRGNLSFGSYTPYYGSASGAFPVAPIDHLSDSLPTVDLPPRTLTLTPNPHEDYSSSSGPGSATGLTSWCDSYSAPTTGFPYMSLAPPRVLTPNPCEDYPLPSSVPGPATGLASWGSHCSAPTTGLPYTSPAPPRALTPDPYMNPLSSSGHIANPSPWLQSKGRPPV
jgi:hypothetical protein